MDLELRLSVEDSPNSAGVVIDAIRCAKLGLDRGLSGTLEAPSSYFKKSPPVQYTDDEARQLVEDFINKYRLKPGEKPKPRPAASARAGTPSRGRAPKRKPTRAGKRPTTRKSVKAKPAKKKPAKSAPRGRRKSTTRTASRRTSTARQRRTR